MNVRPTYKGAILRALFRIGDSMRPCEKLAEVQLLAGSGAVLLLDRFPELGFECWLQLCSSNTEVLRRAGSFPTCAGPVWELCWTVSCLCCLVLFKAPRVELLLGAPKPV